MRIWLVLLTCALGNPAFADEDPWLGRDKAKHFGASAALAVAGYGVASGFTDRTPLRLAGGTALALGLGLAKEIADRGGHGDPSRRDMAWNVAGTATGLLTAWVVDRYLWRRLFPAPASGPRAQWPQWNRSPGWLAGAFGVISPAHVRK